MLRLLKKSWWLLFLALGLQSASAFSLLGIREPYHVPQLNYGGDFGDAPHNLGEEFRWNIPTLYYAYDESFLDYFGSNGVYSIDSAMQVVNAVLSTNVSSWSRDLTEFPLQATRINFAAAAMHLFDLKSAVLELMMERLCLADPERFTWTLRNRVSTGPCPSFLYAVIKRNFDPVTWEPTSYVNGNLFTYFILEGCPAVDSADAIEVLVDPDGLYGTAVASFPISYGFFHTGITRDDAGGLRYLYRSNNVNLESAGPNTFTYVTNTVPELIVSSNLTLLAAQALTNSAAALQALYPNLVILSSTNFWTNIWVDTVTAYFTNSPYQPAYFPPTLAFATNRTLTVQTLFHHLFGNLATIEFRDGQWVAVPVVDIMQQTGLVYNVLMTINVTNATSPSLPAYTFPLVTNVTIRRFLTNAVAGEFIILPTNACDLAILAPQLAITNFYTNTVLLATNIGNTNLLSNTNFVNATNLANMSYEVQLIDSSVTHAFIVNQIFCPTSNVALRQGIESVKFIRRDYDSLLGRYWYPVTNVYKVVAITNNTAYEQTIQRIITQPDFVFSAADLTSPPTTAPWANVLGTREVPRWDTNGVLPGVFGPGTVQPTVNFTFNKVGPLYVNNGPLFLDEATAILHYIWASYDGSTNAPVVFPSGTSLVNMENQILMPVTVTDLVSGIALGMTNVLSAATGAEARFQFSAAGGQPPYSWALAPASPNLPPGFDPPGDDGNFADGIIGGTPTAGGKYIFTLRMSDSAGRFVDRPYILNIQ
jgi:hypothetical protein